MTREEMKVIREKKKADKFAARDRRKQDKKELKSWEKMVAKAKAKGAWIEETDAALKDIL